MIPVTFPSKRDKILNKDSCTVYFLTSISGLTRWVDYIPVQLISTSSTKEATYNVSAYQPINTLPNITSKIRWVDYIPVYIDNSATVPFSTNANGYIPVGMPYTSVTKIFEAKGYNGYAHNFEESFYLNQLSTGTTPITAVTDPAGLVMDTRLGMALGSDLVTNGDFALAGDGWTSAGVSFAVGEVTIPDAPSATEYFFRSITVSQYKTYSITIRGTGTVRFRNDSAAAYTEVTLPITILLPQSTIAAPRAQITNVAGAVATVTSISVKLLEGNHAIQATAGARPTWTNRVNLLTYSEDFSNAAWINDGTTVATNSSLAPDGTTTADTITGTVGNLRRYQTTTLVVGASYTLSVYAKQWSSPTLGIDFINTAVGPIFTFATASFSVVGGFTTSVETLPDGWYRLSVTRLAGTTSGGPGFVVSGATTVILWGGQVSFGTQRYQRVTTATDFDTAGFPYYLSFDGSNDSLTSATGGGGSAGFFWCGVVQPTGGAGAYMILWDDRGTNTGYAVAIDPTGKLYFAAGNGAAYTAKTSTASLNIGTKYLLTVWDDGTNLNVQINSATVETTARPVVSAGSSGFKIGVANAAAVQYLIANLYPSVYWKDTAGTAAERADAQAYARMMAGL